MLFPRLSILGGGLKNHHIIPLSRDEAFQSRDSGSFRIPKIPGLDGSNRGISGLKISLNPSVRVNMNLIGMNFLPAAQVKQLTSVSESRHSVITFTCPVADSLHAAILMTVSFDVWSCSHVLAM